MSAVASLARTVLRSSTDSKAELAQHDRPNGELIDETGDDVAPLVGPLPAATATASTKIYCAHIKADGMRCRNSASNRPGSQNEEIFYCWRHMGLHKD